MGYPVSPNAPRVTTQGRTFCVAAFEWPNPMGSFFRVGVYEQMSDGSWNELLLISQYNNPGACLTEVKKMGGGMKYVRYMIDRVNAFFANLFGSAGPAVVSDPATDEEARAFLTAQIGALKFLLVNGVPVLQ